MECVAPSNFAAHARSALTNTVVVAAVPLQSPLHPTKEDPKSAIAVSWTEVSAGNVVEQFVPQTIPVGIDVIVPFPVPVLVIFRVGFRCINAPATAPLSAPRVP
jgi:hypothetical protein